LHGVGFDGHFKLQMSAITIVAAGAFGFLPAWLRVQRFSRASLIMIHVSKKGSLNTNRFAGMSSLVMYAYSVQ